MIRQDREDLTAQRERVAETRAHLHDALSTLAGEAARAAKAARTKTGRPDLPAVYAASRAVERAEEAVDQAVYDLQTAGGEDG